MKKRSISILILLVLGISLLFYIGYNKEKSSLDIEENTLVVGINKKLIDNSSDKLNKADYKDKNIKDYDKVIQCNILEDDLIKVGKFDTEELLDKKISEALKELMTLNVGIAPWRIIYADPEKILFYNYSHLLAYKTNNDISKIYSGIDLRKLEKGEMQGSVITEFYPSSNGDFLIVSTGVADKSVKKKMYFCNFKNNKVKSISTENYFNLTDSWSDSALFYVFADKSGERIVVYNVKEDELYKIPFNKGIIKDVLISDEGNVIVNSSKKYLLRKQDKYMVAEISISGELLTFKDGNIVFYDSQGIYKYNGGKTEELKKIDGSFKLVKSNDVRSVFSDENSTVVYSYATNKLYRYNFEYDKADYILFSPDSTKCIYLGERHNLKIMGNEGKIFNIVDKDVLNNLGNYKWLDNKNIIRVKQEYETSSKLGDFSIIKFNIETGRSSVIYKNK